MFLWSIKLNSNLPLWSGCWVSSMQCRSRFVVDCSLHSVWSCPHRNLRVCPCMSDLTPPSSDPAPFYCCKAQKKRGCVSFMMLSTKAINWKWCGNYTDPEKQWAAVTTQRGDTSEPPHVCWPPCCRLTCQGQSSMTAFVPPTIRSWEPACPQSDKQHHFVKIIFFTVVHFTNPHFYCMSLLFYPSRS